MEFTVDARVFSSAIRYASSVIGKKVFMPVLQNVLVRADGSEVRIYAMSQQTGVMCTIPCEVLKPGVALLSAHRFAGAMAHIGSGELRLSLESPHEVLRVDYGSGFFQLLCFVSDSYPPFFEVSRNAGFTLDADVVAKFCDRTLYAIARDGSLYQMEGALWKSDGARLSVTGTDGHRVGQHVEPMDLGEFSSIVPLEFMSLVRKMGGELFEFGFDRQFAWVESGETFLVSRVLDGEFPPVDDVMPGSVSKVAVVPSRSLVELARRVSALAESRHRRIDLEFSRDQLVLSFEHPEIGLARDHIPCEYDGPDERLALNYQYLLDAMMPFGDNDVMIGFDEETPVRLTCDKVEGHTALIMPLSLD